MIVIELVVAVMLAELVVAVMLADLVLIAMAACFDQIYRGLALDVLELRPYG